MSSLTAILCIDIDGTLIDSQVRMHPADIKVLNNFPQSIQPVMTTGRDLPSFKRVLRENNLFENISFPLPGVFMNGGVTYLPGEKISHKHVFPSETRSAVIQLAGDFPKTTFTFFSIDAVFMVNPNSYGRHISRHHHLAAVETDLANIPKEILKVNVMEPEPTIMQQIRQRSQAIPAEMAISLPHAYEINPLGINKAFSLMTLLSAMHIEKLPIYVVGDSENDLPLFNLAQTNFAPTSAHPKVITRTDHLILRETEGLLTPIIRYIQSSLDGERGNYPKRPEI